jgi:hypothetical protein
MTSLELRLPLVGGEGHRGDWPTMIVKPERMPNLAAS